MKLGEVVVQFDQASSKSDEKQNSFINNPFFCSEFQSVSGIVKIVHSGDGLIFFLEKKENNYNLRIDSFPHC